MQLVNLYHRSLEKHLFLGSFIILWVYYILLYPAMSYASQLFFEAGPNFLYHAYSYNLRTNIWTPDAGYLVWLPRFIALLVSIFASPYQYVYITNIIALAFVAFFVAFFNHQGFRSILPSDNQRFLLSLLLGMIILPIFEVLSFINFSYVGFIFIGFLLFLNKQKLSCLEYGMYMVLCALLCISKLHFIVFLPFFLVTIGLHWYRKEYRSALFYLPSLLTIGIQVLFVLFKTSSSPFVINYTIYDSNILEIILKAFRGFGFWSMAYGTNFRFLGHGVLAQLLGLALFSYLVFLLVQSYKKKEISSNIVLVFIVFNLISLAFGFMSSLSTKTELENILLNNGIYPFSRRGFISYDMVWLSCVILLLNVKRVSFFARGGGRFDNRNKQIFLGIFLVLTIVTTFPKTIKKEWYEWMNPDRLSDWKNLHSLFSEKEYYIPVDPSPSGLFSGISSSGVQLTQFSDNPYIPESRNKLSPDFPLYDNINFNPDGSLQYVGDKKILAMIIECPIDTNVSAQTYNDRGQLLATSRMLSDTDMVYKYLLFDEHTIPARITFVNGEGKKLTDVKMAAIYGLTGPQ